MDDYFERRRRAVVDAMATALARRRVSIVFSLLLAVAMLVFAVGAMTDAATAGNSFGIMTGVASVFALIGVAAALVGVIRAFLATRRPYPSVQRVRPTEGRWPVTPVGATSFGVVILGLGGVLAFVFWQESPSMAVASLVAGAIVCLVAPFSLWQFRAAPALMEHYLSHDPELESRVRDTDPAWF